RLYRSRTLHPTTIHTRHLLAPRFPFFFLMFLLPPTSTLFPYTTLFRSWIRHHNPDPEDPDAGCHRLHPPRRARRPQMRRRSVCRDRKSTRLNSSHDQISYAVFCLKKKNDTPSASHPSLYADTHRSRALV